VWKGSIHTTVQLDVMLTVDKQWWCATMAHSCYADQGTLLYTQSRVPVAAMQRLVAKRGMLWALTALEHHGQKRFHRKLYRVTGSAVAPGEGEHALAAKSSPPLLPIVSPPSLSLVLLLPAAVTPDRAVLQC
jgi:hypothetical protein